MTTSPATPQPSRSDRLKPLELVGGSGLFAVFVGIVVLVTTRDLTFALIGLGIVFIITLVMLAMLSMTFKPDAAEVLDIDEQDRSEDERHG